MRGPGAERSSRRVIVTAILINILNPKLSIFFLAFLPQFIAADEPAPLARMLELSGAFMAMTFAVFAVYGLFAAGVRDRVITRPKAMAWLRRSFAAGFAALGRQAGVCGTVDATMSLRRRSKGGRKMGPLLCSTRNRGGVRIGSPGGTERPTRA